MDRITLRAISSILMLCIAADASASGWRPFAQRDSITVVQGGTATRLDSGNFSVLDNDFDIEGDDLEAYLDEAPRHGTLELRTDGTFVYVHDGGNDDEDQFRYRAWDGTRYSRSTRVDIEIEESPNSPPFVTCDVPDQEAAEGAYFEYDFGECFADPDPDDALAFKAKGLPGSNSLTIDPVTGVLSGTPEVGDARNRPYDVEIEAKDRRGENARLKFDLYILEEARPDVSLAINVVANPIGVGEMSQWDIVIANNGPGEVDQGALAADWATAGPSLDLTAPDGCSLSSNNTSTPKLSCDLAGLRAGESRTYAVAGVQAGAGDNSLIGVVIADDPRLDNNSDLASAHIVDQFSEGPTQMIDTPGTDISAGDLNGDGEIDVVSTGSETTIYFNSGNRALSVPGTSLGGSSGASSVALLDWNGDTNLDVAIGGLANRTAEIFVNDGSGGFSSAERIQASVGTVRSIASADFNSDGLFDLVIAGSGSIAIAINDGQGSANLSTLSSAGGLSVTTSDIDGDGDSDVAAVRESNRSVRLYFNNGSGTSFTLDELQFGSVATLDVSDINSDGSPDLLLGLDGDDLQPPRHQVALQQGNGQFSAGQTFGASPVSGLLTGDINGDGWPDIATVTQTGVHQVYLGSSQGSLALAPEQLVSNGMLRGVLVDFNSDESLDLLLIGPGSAGLEIHANNGIGSLGLGDRIAPTLTLLGESTMQVPAGQPYIEPGVSAIDDIDGDISDLVEVLGEINTTVVGTQSLTYNVQDRAGNTATATRTIQIGVNSGGGGQGGGAASPLLILLLAMFAIRRRLLRI